MACASTTIERGGVGPGQLTRNLDMKQLNPRLEENIELALAHRIVGARMLARMLLQWVQMQLLDPLRGSEPA